MRLRTPYSDAAYISLAEFTAADPYIAGYDGKFWLTMDTYRLSQNIQFFDQKPVKTVPFRKNIFYA